MQIEVLLNEKMYVIEIEEIDKNCFMSQQIAVAKAYAKVEKICHYRLIERLAYCISSNLKIQDDKNIVMLWHKAFKNEV